MLLCGLTDKDLRKICGIQYEHPGSAIGHPGSARLKFGGGRYYEFLCFDVPKVFRSPGYDHGHDEES